MRKLLGVYSRGGKGTLTTYNEPTGSSVMIQGCNPNTEQGERRGRMLGKLRASKVYTVSSSPV